MPFATIIGSQAILYQRYRIAWLIFLKIGYVGPLQFTEIGLMMDTERETGKFIFECLEYSINRAGLDSIVNIQKRALLRGGCVVIKALNGISV